jgi:hypothetical protein
VTFLSERVGNLDVWTKQADGAGVAELILDHEVRLAEAFWSPDREWLIIRTGGVPGVVGGRDILGLRPGVDSMPLPLVASEFDEAGPSLSPDGRWLAYQSDETGQKEVFIKPFPDTEGAKVQVSDGGGIGAVWAHSGEELFYVTGAFGLGPSLSGDDRIMMSARFRGGPLPTVIERRPLFRIPNGVYLADQTASYVVTQDDQSFLMIRNVAADDYRDRSELILIQNWFTELEERLGGGR